MQQVNTGGASTGNGKSIVVWIGLLTALTVAGALPFMVSGMHFRAVPGSRTLAWLTSAGVLLTAFAPGLAALLTVAALPQAGGMRLLLRQVRTWRVGVGWYAIAFIAPVILKLSANWLHILLGGPPPDHWLALPILTSSGKNNVLFMIFGMPIGALGEELGWRGFAQPRLQDRYNALVASLLVGTVWSTWHLWYVITPGGFSSVSRIDVLATYIRLISTAIVYAWMYNTTQGSLLLVTIAHAGHNIALTFIQSPRQVSDVNHLMLALAYFAAAVAVVLMTNPRTLVRQKVEALT